MQNRDDSAAIEGEVREQVLGAPDIFRGLVTMWVSVSPLRGIWVRYLLDVWCLLESSEPEPHNKHSGAPES